MLYVCPFSPWHLTNSFFSFSILLLFLSIKGGSWLTPDIPAHMNICVSPSCFNTQARWCKGGLFPYHPKPPSVWLRELTLFFINKPMCKNKPKTLFISNLVVILRAPLRRLGVIIFCSKVAPVFYPWDRWWLHFIPLVRVWLHSTSGSVTSHSDRCCGNICWHSVKMCHHGWFHKFINKLINHSRMFNS